MVTPTATRTAAMVKTVIEDGVISGWRFLNIWSPVRVARMFMKVMSNWKLTLVGQR